ncbi:met regulon transcriptional regulator MetJ, partial [Salmonella enterica subsp. enterica serovar Poona]
MSGPRHYGKLRAIMVRAQVQTSI